MKSPRFWIAVLVAGVVLNALDFVVQGKLLTDSFYAGIDSMRHDTSIGWFVFGDFVQVLVFAWVFDRISGAFASGVAGGACAGFFLGVLVNFPANHFIFLMFKGVPYRLAWINTIYGVLWYVIAGVIVAALLKKPSAAVPVAAPATS